MTKETNTLIKRNLADLFRALDYLNISDLTANHASGIASDSKSFFINQHKHLFSEINTRNLVNISIKKPLISKLKKVNKAGYYIHKHLHLSEAKPKYILHTHSHNAVAISCLKSGFNTELNQSSMRFYDSVNYFDYSGMVIDDIIGKDLARQTNKNTKLIILKNHGVIIQARSIAELFHLTFHFEKCVQIQLMLENIPSNKLNKVNKKVITTTNKQHESFGPVGLMSWQAIKRVIKN